MFSSSLRRTAVCLVAPVFLIAGHVGAAQAASPHAPRVVSAAPPPGVVVGATFVYRSRATGAAPRRWSLARGPRGMAVNRRTGAVTWTPTRPGRFRVTLLVRNARGSARQSFRLVVRASPAVAVLAAGDIASCASENDEATARVLDANPSVPVLTLGDNAYNAGSASEFASCFAPGWGRHVDRVHPAPGNHDYGTPGAAGYFGYFGLRAGIGSTGYYSFDLGDWHLVSLNSEADFGASGAQLAWLRADLAATAKRCVLAYWHRPRFAAGSYSDHTQYTPFWDALYAAGAEIVLNGHDHNYQRYQPMTPQGATDAVNGIRQFIVGTGGVGAYPLKPDSRREAAGSGIFGLLKLTLKGDSYEWRFLPAEGSAFSDSGTGSCR